MSPAVRLYNSLVRCPDGDASRYLWCCGYSPTHSTVTSYKSRQRCDSCVCGPTHGVYFVGRFASWSTRQSRVSVGYGPDVNRHGQVESTYTQCSTPVASDLHVLARGCAGWRCRRATALPRPALCACNSLLPRPALCVHCTPHLPRSSCPDVEELGPFVHRLQLQGPAKIERHEVCKGGERQREEQRHH